MDEALLVGCEQTSARCHHDVEYFQPVTLLLTGPVAQRLAHDVLHGHEHAVAVDPGVVHRDDVGVREAGECLRFP